MRQLFPVRAEVDPDEVYVGADRPVPPDRPWVLLNMIASVDGATSVEGRSGELGGPADKAVFRSVRACADVILVGASTVRTEGYRPPTLSEQHQQRRISQGRAPVPRLAIVSGSLALDPEAPVFAAGRPIVVTHEASDARRREDLGAVAQVVVAGSHRVELPRALSALRAAEVRTVLCEGGPTLNAQLVGDDLLDELCFTLSPVLAGGPSERLLGNGPLSGVARLHLDRVLEADGLLFLRYLRDGGPSTDRIG
ncbi:MAG: pyrimidine reductase family protein [Acidimicrobiales bacterium]|nr:pyrimidine reductase family protein [Acidimicrobiales bacterium]